MSTALLTTREAPCFRQPWPITRPRTWARRHGWSLATITAPATAAGSMQGAASLPWPRTAAPEASPRGASRKKQKHRVGTGCSWRMSGLLAAVLASVVADM
jgi:hypothetical protein